jgi:tetratricopeptide (TPR) repeat protein
MSCRPEDLQDLAYGFLDEEAEARVRAHVESCPPCRAAVRRLDAEKRLLARAARAPASAPARGKTSLVPLGFAAALLLGLLWILAPRAPEGPPVAGPAVPGAQDKKTPAGPVDEEGLQAELKRLDDALAKASDPREAGRLKTAIGELKIRLERLREGKDAGQPDKTVVKVRKDPFEQKVKTELEGLYLKLKTEKDPEERMRLEKRIQELGQDMKLLEQGSKPQVNLKELDLRLQRDPDDVESLVQRASFFLDSGKADPALRDLDRAIVLKPDLARAWLKRGLAYAFRGDFTRAWQDAKRGEELDLKAGKEIDAAFGAIKKLQGASQEKLRKPMVADLEQRIVALRDRLSELKGMAGSAELPAAERERAGRDAVRVEAEIERLQADLKALPPETKVEKKK